MGAPGECLSNKFPLTQGEALETEAKEALAWPLPRTSASSSQGNRKNVNLLIFQLTTLRIMLLPALGQWGLGKNWGGPRVASRSLETLGTAVLGLLCRWGN